MVNFWCSFWKDENSLSCVIYLQVPHLILPHLWQPYMSSHVLCVLDGITLRDRILPNVRFFFATYLIPFCNISSKTGSWCKIGKYFLIVVVWWRITHYSLFFEGFFRVKEIMISIFAEGNAFSPINNFCAVSISWSKCVLLEHVLIALTNSPMGRLRIVCVGWQLSAHSKVLPYNAVSTLLHEPNKVTSKKLICEVWESNVNVRLNLLEVRKSKNDGNSKTWEFHTRRRSSI